MYFKACMLQSIRRGSGTGIARSSPSLIFRITTLTFKRIGVIHVSIAVDATHSQNDL